MEDNVTDIKWNKSTCSYCGFGCGLMVGVKQGKVVKITVNVINNNVIIKVCDTGIGIETDDIPKLFSPFVRLQTSLTYKTSGGTGLGPYLVKKIAKDFLRGDVEVKSEFGKGSTFTLSVPVELEEKV